PGAMTANAMYANDAGDFICVISMRFVQLTCGKGHDRRARSNGTTIFGKSRYAVARSQNLKVEKRSWKKRFEGVPLRTSAGRRPVAWYFSGKRAAKHSHRNMDMELVEPTASQNGQPWSKE